MPDSAWVEVEAGHWEIWQWWRRDLQSFNGAYAGCGALSLSLGGVTSRFVAVRELMQQAAGEAQQHSRFHPAQADLEQVQCPKAQCSAVTTCSKAAFLFRGM